ncbi:MAG TPA: hypothetical protein VMN03_05470 [Burkholderiales bacterium]|nr:hypothetical protein [Burkholderiales bacterium]
MKFFTRRRLRNGAILAAAVLLCLFANRILLIALRPSAIYTGCLLFVLLLGLTFINGRKKLPFLPLLKASTWVQVHVYAGFFSIFLFLVHLGFRMPNGKLEVLLALLFVVVAVSGIFGLAISRWLPPRITRSGEPLVFERIPRYRAQLRSEVERLVEEAERRTGSSAIGDFYVEVLAPYFQHRHGLAILVGDPARYEHRITARIDDFSRYLDADELATIEALRGHIGQKRNLDFQGASQRLLKVWLFVHIPLTYSLLIVAVVHGWIALSYAGGF